MDAKVNEHLPAKRYTLQKSYFRALYSPALFMKEDSSIRIRGLYKKYRGSKEFALKGIDLEIRDGEIFGILGPNGAGKTTLLSILSGLVESGEGDVTVCGYSVKESIQSIKKLMGIVPQSIALYPGLSGRDNLLYIGRMYGMDGKELKRRVDAALALFGFDSNANDAVKKYSGGMKRRINLIGGLLHDPKVLLLDEPTLEMDVQTRASIIEHLKKINREKRMTILYTSHYLEQAETFCDRIAIIDQGNILCKGTPAQLMAQEGCTDLEEVFLKLTGRKIRD